MSVSKPTYDSTNGLQNIEIGSLTAGQREKVIAQCLLFIADGALGNIDTFITSAVAMKVDNSDDMVEVITYLDAGTPEDRRVSTITRTSANLSLSYTDTFTYAGSSGDYYLTGRTRS